MYHVVIVKSIVVWYIYRKGGIKLKKNVTFSFDEELIELLKKISDKTMIPQSRIVESAIRERLEKMEPTAK